MVAQEAAAKAAHETILRRESGAARAAVRYFIRTADRPRQGQCMYAPRVLQRRRASRLRGSCWEGWPDQACELARSSQIKECQLAACGARLQRTHDVERDTSLKTALWRHSPTRRFEGVRCAWRLRQRQ